MDANCGGSRMLVPVFATVALVACSSPTGPGSQSYEPDIPTQWAAAVTNAFFPLTPGMRWDYEGETDEGTETNTVEVLEDTRMIMGVEATVVHDQVFLDGDLIENTFDWYAQAANGDVWYLGEASEEIDGGVVASAEGSWEWGVDDALPGIIMWANPSGHINEKYRQEFYEGEAEDWAKVLRTGESVSVPFANYAGCIVTEDWSALEPGTRENKTYCAGVGVVFEKIVRGGNEETALIDFVTP